MNTLVAASLALAAGAASVFADVQRDSKPPAPYNDKVVLPGNVPPAADSLNWSQKAPPFRYRQSRVAKEKPSDGIG